MLRNKRGIEKVRYRKKLKEMLKEALLIVAYVIACSIMWIGIIMTELSKDGFIEEETHATSQEKETEKTTEPPQPTGQISMNGVGMVEAVDDSSESIVAKCQWTSLELTQSELELLYTTVYCEAGNQELEAQIMVAQTIINRIISPKYPDTLRGVIYQRNSAGAPQFSVINWSDYEKRGWTDKTKAAVHYALSYKAYPDAMLYFRSGGHYHNFGQPYKQVDDMYFSLEVK